MHHSDFIAVLASIYKPKVYVELGLYQGETLAKVRPYIGRGYGVDMKSIPQVKNHIFNNKQFF